MDTEQVGINCATCLYFDVSLGDNPCNICIAFSQWEDSIEATPIEVAKRCSNCAHCDDSCISLFNESCGPDKKHFLARAVSADKVDPKHYNRFKIQPTTFCVENNLNFLQGNIIKYVCRFPYKGGVMDLKKAARYLEELIARAEVDNGKFAA